MSKPKARILLVEDDKNLGFVVKDFLADSGYEVDLAINGMAGLTIFQQNRYDILLIDIMLPVMDGFTLAEKIKEKNDLIPIVFLTARSLKEDRIKGFRTGADDYITKPFSTEELLLRIEAILRRTNFAMLGNGQARKQFVIGNYRFDYSNQVLEFDGIQRSITRKEAALLQLLCLNINQVVRRDIALKMIWGEDDYFMGRSMDVYISKLRKMLKNDPTVTIQNIHRTGFKLEVKE